MPSARVDLDHAAIARLAARDDVRAALRQRADVIAGAARGRGVMIDGEPGDQLVPIETADGIEGDHARAVVYIPHAAGLAVESKHRLLVGSIDAAR